MKNNLSKMFQVAAVFIGTIVGAGLASGKEITEFFTSYGAASFIGIILCGFFYIGICTIISNISSKYSLNSYTDLINLVSPNILGKITGIITTLYLFSSASIILAGSGALLNQFLGIPKIVGSVIMLLMAITILLKGTDGLIGVNLVIVPSLIIIISILTILYFAFANDSINLDYIMSIKPLKSNWELSTLLYGGYNILCCSGVLVPLSTKFNNKKHINGGIFFGVIGLTLLCLCINLMLMLNIPHIFSLEIPLLYVANRFGKIIQIFLVAIILLEMFSTEISDVYSISKSIEQTFKIKFKKAIFLVIIIALPVSQIGFSNLITTLYPLFGLLSLIFVSQCIYFYFKSGIIKK